MIVAVLASEDQRKEFKQKGLPEAITVCWADTVKTLQLISDADIYMDLLFYNEPMRTRELKKLLPKPVVINSVVDTLSETGLPFIRINAWPTFLKRTITEVCTAKEQHETVKQVFNKLGWQYKIVPDISGMVTARIVAAVINEAYHTLGEGTSTREDIDTAMRLGTNYPYGPFEWCRQIGIARVLELLKALQKKEKRFEPAPALEAEIRLSKELPGETESE
jgi:3-hydroxybutyryl-CoA dehydrogenase